jgi:long-subunit acyl-CoA synthetase (AMP-forming)
MNRVGDKIPGSPFTAGSTHSLVRLRTYHPYHLTERSGAGSWEWLKPRTALSSRILLSLHVPTVGISAVNRLLWIKTEFGLQILGRARVPNIRYASNMTLLYAD